MPYSISPISSRHSSLASSSIHNHKFPPANSLYQLAGKSNFQLWLSAIKPYLFSNIESTGLILGGWAEPKPGPNPWSKPTAPTTGEDDPTSTSEHWDRERWTAANTETCRFIRGTLAMNVIPHVRQHHTAKALWHNLLWLYGEEAGIDTQGGPSGPVSGPPESANSNGNENLSARNRKGGNGNRSKLLAALAAKNSTAVEFDLDVNVATPASSSSRPMLPPVTKTFGVGSPSKSYGAFLEVPSFDGPEEQAEQDEEGEDFEDDIADNAPKNSVVNNAPTPNPVIVTITESTTHSKNGISKGKETSTPLGQTTSQQILPKPSTPESQVKDNTATNLSTVHEDEEAVHPGRRVDLSDSSALIRYHHRRSMSISHLPHPSRERDAKVSLEHHHSPPCSKFQKGIRFQLTLSSCFHIYRRNMNTSMTN